MRAREGRDAYVPAAAGAAPAAGAPGAGAPAAGVWAGELIF